MKVYFYNSFFFSLAILLSSCSSNEEQQSQQIKQQNLRGEYIYRVHDEYLFLPPPPILRTRNPYPWEIGLNGNNAKITKEYFRCKGSTLNLVRQEEKNGELVLYNDCGGAQKHSLPLKDKKEFIYPILLDIVNYIQMKTDKKVVITSGHRCPEHNAYTDSSSENMHSKHMLGAEVAFYVQGMEDRPETIVKMIQDYYKNNSKYKDKKDYLEFSRYDKEDINVSTPPWYNKEIFIKLYRKIEGRNFDNRHPYPYLSVQVRWDEELQEKVIYTWDKATRNYMRW